MDKITAFIEEKVAPVANRLSSQKYLKALQSTFLFLIPFFTIGSFALVLISPPMDYTTMDPGFLCSFMQGWQAFADFTGPVLEYVYNVTMPLMSLYVAMGISYNLCKEYKMNTMMPILITVSSFIISASMNGDRSLTFAAFDATGLFTAIFVGISSFELYRVLVEKKVGRISLEGSGVPPALADSIGNLVPVAIVIVLVAFLNNLLFSLTSINLTEVITIIMTPLVTAVDNVWGVIVLAIIVMVFWWFGIHDSVITSALDPFFYSNLGANAAAFAAGTAAVALPHVVTAPFWWNFMAIGGSGATLGLAFLALTSKSKQLKTIGKLAFIPSLFNINEPLIFGLPLMYNPIMMIPFIIVMPLNGLITYLAMSSGIVARTFAYASWNMFSPIAALIDTMDIKAVLLIVVLINIDILIYLPFYKAIEKEKLAEEQE